MTTDDVGVGCLLFKQNISLYFFPKTSFWFVDHIAVCLPLRFNSASSSRGNIVNKMQWQRGNRLWKSEAPLFLSKCFQGCTNPVVCLQSRILMYHESLINALIRLFSPYYSESTMRVELDTVAPLLHHSCIFSDSHYWNVRASFSALWTEELRKYGDAKFLHATLVLLLSKERWVKLNNKAGSCSISWGISTIPWTTANLVKKKKKRKKVPRLLQCWPGFISVARREKKKSHKSEAVARITRLPEREGAAGQTERARDRFRMIYGVEVLGWAEGLRGRLG